MKNIILFGFMGTGKTTVGKIISKKLNLPLLDMDSIITQEEGKSIKLIFNENGESYFRNLENKLVRRLSKHTDNIISTGGGVILNEENITLFRENSFLVCLTASPKNILERLRNDTTRPLLRENNIEKENEINHLLKERKKMYNKISFQINTDFVNPQLIAQEIIRKYNKNN